MKFIKMMVKKKQFATIYLTLLVHRYKFRILFLEQQNAFSTLECRFPERCEIHWWNNLKSYV